MVSATEKEEGERLQNYEVGVILCEGWGQRRPLWQSAFGQRSKEVKESLTWTSAGRASQAGGRARAKP